jgi:hypothetical protein
MAWIAPATALTWVEGNRRTALLAAGTMALTFLITASYDALLAGRTWSLMLVIMRNAALMGTLLAAAAVLLRNDVNR